MKSQRLLVLAPSLREFGGAARRMALLLECLQSKDQRVLVVCRGAHSMWPRISFKGGCTILEVPGFNVRWLGMVVYSATALIVGTAVGRRARAVLSVQLYSQLVVGALVSRLWATPLFAFSTTSGQLSETNYIKRSRLHKFRVWCLRQCKLVLAQTESVAEEVRALNGQIRVQVLSNPVKLQWPPPLNGKPLAIYAGRFSEEKGLFDLMDAWLVLVKQYPDVRLVLAGAGGGHRSVEPELTALIRQAKELSGTVSLTGWIDEVSQYFREADVMVLPSYSEGMSNALLEACSFGRVVVASDIEPNRLILGDSHPLLFRAGDVKGLALALRDAFFDEGKRTTARKNALAGAEAASLERFTSAIEALLDAADSSRY